MFIDSEENSLGNQEIFIRCLCTEEIISISKIFLLDPNTEDYIIRVWRSNNSINKKAKDLEFFFMGSESFNYFKEELNKFVIDGSEANNLILSKPYCYFNKYLDNAKNGPSMLVTKYTKEHFSISKYKDPKSATKSIGQPEWEIMLDKKMSQKLLEAIKYW